MSNYNVEEREVDFIGYRIEDDKNGNVYHRYCYTEYSYRGLNRFRSIIEEKKRGGMKVLKEEVSYISGKYCWSVILFNGKTLEEEYYSRND